MVFIFGILISFIAIVIHYEGLRVLTWILDRKRQGHRSDMLLVMSVVVTLHLMEVLVYATLYWIRTTKLGIDSFDVERKLSFFEYYYFSLETFTTLGYGDLYFEGNARFFSSLEGLIGLLLIGWSASFVLLVLRERWDQLRNKSKR